jgi:hypothetical protein
VDKLDRTQVDRSPGQGGGDPLLLFGGRKGENRQMNTDVHWEGKKGMGGLLARL